MNKTNESVKVIYYKSYKDFFDNYFFKNSSYNFALNKVYVFRGEGDEHYQLIPSAYRPSSMKILRRLMETTFLGSKLAKEINTNIGRQILAEWSAFKFFYQNANLQGLPLPQLSDKWIYKLQNDEPPEISNLDEWIPKELAEVFALMQHYGFPTRMLDWSYSLHVATYFAAMSGAYRLKNNSATEDEHIVIWIMNLGQVNKILVDDYGKQKIKTITPLYSNNPNLNAQKGVLTYIPINHNQILHNDDPLNKMSFDKYIEYNYKDKGTDDLPLLEKAIIPIKDCHEILYDLDAVNVNRLSIYPGYSSIYPNCLDYLSFIGDG